MADPLNFAALQPQLSLADALQKLAALGLDSPEKVAAVQRLAATPGAAENFAAYDAARYQPIKIGPPPIQFTPPAQSPTIVVDRVTFNTQQAQEAQRMADELKQQQATEYLKAIERENNYQQARQAALGYADAATGGLASTVQRNFAPGGTFPKLGEQYDRENLPDNLWNTPSQETGLGYVTDPALQAYSDLPINNPSSRPANAGYESTVLGAPGQFARSAYDIATTEIPGAKRAAQAAGDVAGGLVKYSPTTAGANLLSERLPDVFGKDVSLSNVGATAIETLIPVEVWQAALTLLPAAKARSIPELLSAITLGDTDAWKAIKSLKPNLADSEIAQAARLGLEKLSGESGRLVIPGTAKTVAWGDLSKAPQVLDTSGIAYHGAGGRFKSFDEGLMDTTALHGPGVYLTDDTKIAKGYAENRARLHGGEAIIQTVQIKPGLRILNMERPLPLDAAEVFTKFAGDLDHGDLVIDAITAGKSGAQVSTEMREALYRESLPESDAGEFLQGINEWLPYEGIAHTGGIRGGAKHTVTVIFDPANVEVATPMTRALDMIRTTAGKLASEAGASKIPGKKPGGELVERLARSANTNSALTPPEHQELIAALREIMPTAADRRAELATGRARQFGNRQSAINAALAAGKSNKEALAAGKRAMSGDILTRKNLLGVFSDARVDGYYGDIRLAERAGQITSPESIAAQNGMDLLTTGVRSNGNNGPIMKHEADALARVFGPDIINVLPTAPAKMTAFQKIFAPVQIYRSWKTGFDDSFGLGQGWKIMFSDKGAWARGKLAGWKGALSDEKGAEAIMEALRQDSKTFVRGQSAERPLAIMTTGAGTNPAEEFLSPVTRNLPLLSRSERSFVVGGSVMRQLALDRKAAIWEKANPGKEIPDDVFQRMIDMVNEGTNWGHLSEKVLGDWKGPVSQMVFSAHAKAALFQYPITLVKAMAPGADPTLRKMAAGDFAAWIAGNAAVLGAGSGMAALAASVGYNVPGGTGAQVNPFGKNFGQIKFGPQRIDVWQGLAPLVRLVIQSAAAASNGDWKAPGKLSLNYGRNQLAPGFQIPSDYFIGGGRSTIGTSQSSPEYWLNAASPLFVSDAVESLRLLGPAGIPGSLASFEGLRVNTYGNSAKQDATVAKNELQDRLQKAGLPNIEQSYPDAKSAIQQAFSKFYSGPMPETYAEFRDTVIQQAMDKHGITKAEATRQFNDVPIIKAAKANLDKATRAFWAANPQDLKDALDASQTDPADYKDEILKKAGLLK